MTVLMVILRVVHIGCGVFWAGTMFFFVSFLEPSVRAVGPDGGKVIGAIQQRGFMTVMPVMALLTILSGIGVMWQLSAGFSGDWLLSPIGHTYLTGAVASLAAAAVGIGIVRPSALKAGPLGAQLATAGPDEAPALQQELTRLRSRARTAARWVAGLLVVAVVTMAVGRYVPAL